jgi:hypothetical protein
MLLLFLLLLVAAPLLIVVLRGAPVPPRRSSKGRDEWPHPRAVRVDALEVDERIAELEGEFGFLSDRRWRDRGSNG